MTPAQFRSALKRAELTQTAFAELLGHPSRQARRWASGEAEIPRSVAVLLRLLSSGKISLDDLR